MASKSETYWRLVRWAVERKDRQIDEFGNRATEAQLRSLLKFRISWLVGPAPRMPDDDHDVWNLLMDFAEADAKALRRSPTRR